MLTDLTDLTLHFKCQFLLRATTDVPAEAAWRSATEMVYEWVKNHLKSTGFITISQFRQAGRENKVWQQQGCRITTRDTAETPYPRFWTCQLEHPQSDFPHRRWRADVGLTFEENAGVYVALRIFHGLEATYIGTAPAPTPSVPRIVQEVVRSRRWQACLGSLLLRTTPTIPESGKQLWNVLRDTQRRGPVVVLAANEQNQYLLDAQKLSRQLSGVAAVWLLPYEFQQEFVSPYFAGKTHYCQRGAIRVYQAGIKANCEHDSRRHRYLPVKFIEEQGAEQVLLLLVQSLIRQTNYSDVPAIFSPADVEQHQRTERLEQLRIQLEANTSSEHLSDGEREYIALLEENNQQLTQQLQQRKHEASTEELAILEQNVGLESENGQLKFKLEQLEADNRRIKASSTTAITEQLAQLWQQVQELPDSIEAVVELAEKCWSERLAFTTRGKKSAKNTQFNDPNILWRALWHMAHTLHPLYFAEHGVPPLEVEKRFESQAANFKIAHGETKTTRNNANLMKLRKDEYEGRPIDIEPHVKYGTVPPKLLRIYFHRDQLTQKLIIGSCGDHLDTHGTMYQ